MPKLTEDMVVARTKSSDMGAIKKFNCWGSELTDVTLIRRFRNVEVLSLSLNNIATLADFQFCQNLVELYVRRNNIRDLSELCYLSALPRLRRLLLSENPCVETAGAHYRSTVLRCLPNLEILDGTAVTPEEVEMAQKNGLILEHPLDRVSPDSGSYYGRESPPNVTHSGPPNAVRRNSIQYEYEDPPMEYRAQHQAHTAPADYYQAGEKDVPSQRTNTKSPETIAGSNAPIITTQLNMTRRINNNNIANGTSPTSSSDSQYSLTNGSGSTGGDLRLARRISSPEHAYNIREREIQAQMNGRRQSMDYAEQYFDNEPSPRPGQAQVQTPRTQLAGRPTAKQRSKVKNSNLLSAVLCLIPELDWQSLEVVELAIRRRMDELNSD